jgi:hypothetical protein
MAGSKIGIRAMHAYNKIALRHCADDAILRNNAESVHFDEHRISRKGMEA